ncbi:type VI secretion system protein TssA [Trabulsiella odontotermitis]|uniref:type VI secretion system protein TssA n=1 Tax=Trabulsiella odontotermitis TaxID=379893 RepID=UPI0024B63725|nr:type VI secretion system protein TssA [Trabulsiella odontotermitis]WHP32021.1 type VI secretion system protein TssA [Trabulsiella odontotermitis]
MDLRNPDTWISHLLETLPEAKQSCALSDDNPHWEFIESEIVKLGSLAHNQLDLPELQRRGLQLFASESKDLRLLVHLLRTLQHTGDHLLAVGLLTLYVEHFWLTAWPQNATQKKRFADQILKRFEKGIDGFAVVANAKQRDALLGELARLAQLWQTHDAPSLAQAADELAILYRRAFQEAVQATVSGPVTTTPVAAQPGAPTTTAPTVCVNRHDDKAWRETLLKVAEILCERQPESPQGYRLRRHALWQSITSTPQSETDGRTSLAAVSADMAAEYQNRLNNADITLWQQVEQSLLWAPYWLDGHHLSARIAQQLGYPDVADAIRDETSRFLQRLPGLSALKFSDRTFFINDTTRQWLESIPVVTPVTANLSANEDTRLVWQCFEEQGLEAALHLLEQQPEGDLRTRFYREWLEAQMLETAGMKQLARQHYGTLHQSACHISLAEWEPALLQHLEEQIKE